MSFLDDELRKALGREEPPEGFAERVIARLPERPPAVVEIRRRARPVRAWAAAAAAAALLASAGAWALSQRPAQPPPQVANGPGAAPPGPAEPAPNGDRGATPPGPGTVKGPPAEVPSEKLEPPVKIVRHTRAPRRRTARPAAEPRPSDREWQAAEQFMLAMSITSDKLKTVQRRLGEHRGVPET